MELLIHIFGEGKDLNITQMACRAIVVFILSLVMLRIAGRRSFGMKNPLDTIVTILLGSILSRAVAGASPFVPTMGACLAIVLLHRGCGWLVVHSKAFCTLVNGQKMILYQNGMLNKKNMDKSLVNEEDIMEEVRIKALVTSLDKLDEVYMERNGQISSIKKTA